MWTPDDAISYAKRFIGNAPVDDSSLKLRILNDALSYVWFARPWPWTMRRIPDFGLMNDVQDYTFAPPSEGVAWIEDAFMLLGNSNSTRQNLEPSYNLPVTTLKGQPSSIEYVAPSSMRLWPIPSGYGAQNTAPVVSVRIKVPSTEITAGNSNSSSVFGGMPKEFFQIFSESVVLKALHFINSSRTGSAASNTRGSGYSGQYAVVDDLIEKAARAMHLKPVNG